MAETRHCTDCGTPIGPWGARCNVCMQTKAMQEIAEKQAKALDKSLADAQWQRDHDEYMAERDREWAIERARQEEWDRTNPGHQFDGQREKVIDSLIAEGYLLEEVLPWKECLDQYNALKPADERLIKSGVWEDNMSVYKLCRAMALSLRSSYVHIDFFPDYLEEVKEKIAEAERSLKASQVTQESSGSGLTIGEFFIGIIMIMFGLYTCLKRFF